MVLKKNQFKIFKLIFTVFYGIIKLEKGKKKVKIFK